MTVQNRAPERLGPYRLLERLGEGGMGVVYLATDAAGRKVAVKALRPAVAADPTARHRLAREVDTMRRVRSPFVAEVTDADLTADSPYIVTQYVPGRTLDDIVAESGPLTGFMLARLACGLAAALTAVHAAGVVHRDLKPGNVMLVDGEPVLIDFGIAQVLEATRLTLTGMFLGTPGYLAPEVIEGKPGGPAADIHSWGATLAFAATGRPPFGTGSFEAIFYRIVHGRPDLEGMPPDLALLAQRALARDPAERPGARELAQAAAAAALASLTPARQRQTAAAARPGRPPPPSASTMADAPSPVAAVGAADRRGQRQPSRARRFASRWPAAAVPAAGAADLLAPVGYGPLAMPSAPAAAAGRAAPLAGRPPEPAAGGGPAAAGAPTAAGTPARTGAPALPASAPRTARSAWSPLVLALVIAGIAASIAAPVAGTAAVLAAMIALRAGGLIGERLARRRGQAGRRRSDPVLAFALFPAAACRSLLRFVLLAPLGLLAAGIVTATAVLAIPLNPLPRALGWGAGALVAFYGLGPGSRSCRRPLGRLVGAAARNPVAAVLTSALIAALVVAAIAAAASAQPLYWPAASPRALLSQLPGLHGLMTGVWPNFSQIVGQGP